jgi:hypothetical protein
MRSLSTLLLTCGVLLMSESVIAQNAADYYYPLQVGNYWKYHVAAYGGSGYAPGTSFHRIDSLDPIAGYNYWREVGVEARDASPADTSIFMPGLWIRSDAIGNIVLGAFAEGPGPIDSATIVDPPVTLFANEMLTVGYSREYTEGDVLYQDSVLSKTETVSVPAGVFANCLVVRGQHRDNLGSILYREYTYYAPGVGVVKRIVDLPSDNAHVGDLIQYVGLSAVDVGDVASAVRSFVLDPVRPNPSRGGSLTVHFSLPTDAPARLELLDVAGRRIASHDVGMDRHTLDLGAGQHLAPGLYLVRLAQGANTRTTRVAVLR